MIPTPYSAPTLTAIPVELALEPEAVPLAVPEAVWLAEEVAAPEEAAVLEAAADDEAADSALVALRVPHLALSVHCCWPWRSLG